MNWNKTGRWLGVLLIGMMAAGCGAAVKDNPAKQAPAKLAVGTSLYTLAEFTRQVGGERVAVTQFVPEGVEPHDWEPTPKDLAKLQAQRVFIYNGKGLEPWLDNAQKAVAGKGVAFVLASEGIASLAAAHEAGEGHGASATHQHHHQDGGEDPHVWLDPLLAKQQVELIKTALSKADPGGREYYETRAQIYGRELDKLDQEYRAVVAKAAKREFVTTHAAFGYLAKRYGLQQLAIMGISPHAEPTPADLANLVEEVKEHQINVIFFETLISPSLAETIARQTGAKTLVLNPLEGLTADDAKRNETYLTIMRRNLANLATALQAP